MDYFKQIFLKIISVITCLGMLLSSCSTLPPEVQDEIDRQLEEQTDQLIEIIKEEVSDEWEELKESAEQEYEEIKADAIQTAKEWAGLAAPADIGILDDNVVPLTARFIIPSAFAEAYMRFGGRLIGWPSSTVQLSDGLLIQYFRGGSYESSAIAMQDGTGDAFVLPGIWLETYESLGIPSQIGYPRSDPETWNLVPVIKFWEDWGRGERQLFNRDGSEYALMKPSGIDVIHVMPPRHWQKFQDVKDDFNIGYPLSSFPLEDDNFQESLQDPETIALINLWEDQDFRVQVFENGSFISRDGSNQIEVLQAKPLASFMNLDEANLLLGVRVELGTVYENHYYYGNSETCFAQSLYHAANLAGPESGESFIYQVAFIPLQATLTAVSLGVESTLGQFAILLAKVITERASGNDWGQGVKSTFAAKVVDSLYAKAIGDIISKPATKITLIALEEEYNRLSKDRISRTMEIKEGEAESIRFEATMDVTLTVEYDPLLQTVSGVISSGCHEPGYAFFYRVDPSTAKLADPTETWDGRVHFIDLETGDDLQ